MKELDQQYMETPFYGRRKMTLSLREQGHEVNVKRVARLMGVMGIQAIYPKPKTTVRSSEHKVYPYLLHNKKIEQPDLVWCTDITYIPLKGGYMYLVAVMDWFSRYVLSWQLSNTLDAHFCIDALEMAFAYGKPQIFNMQIVRGRLNRVVYCSHQIENAVDGSCEKSKCGCGENLNFQCRNSQRVNSGFCTERRIIGGGE